MLVGIFVSVAGSALSLSPFMVWSFLVIGTLSITAWLKHKLPSSSLVLYFMISVLGGLLFLLGSCAWLNQYPIVMLALLLKMGLFPFQFWINKVLSHLPLMSLCFFLGPMKTGLLYLLLNTTTTSLALATLSLLLGGPLMWVANRLYLVLYGSGACLLIVLVLLGPSLFPVFWAIYVISLLGVGLTVFAVFSPQFSLFSLSGLPPLSMFWAKALALYSLPLSSGFVVLLSSLVTIYPYMRTAMSLSSPHHTSLSYALAHSTLPLLLAWGL